MTHEEIIASKIALFRKYQYHYGDESRISMHGFLKLTWDVSNDLVYMNQDNDLVREASQWHVDLDCALFTLTTVFFGSKSSAPTMRQLLMYAISLFGQDLIEEELQLTIGVPLEKNAFYPHLADHLRLTREIYDMEKYPLNSLPVTPFVAFTKFVLCHADDIGILDRRRMFKCFEQERIKTNRQRAMLTGGI